MAVTWVICGAGRAVGKTHVAQRLCAVLPGSVYAKCGCGRRRAKGPPNYFGSDRELQAFVDDCGRAHQHVVVESNAWARNGKGDVIIFIDGVPGTTDVRGDVKALRARAHLQVGPDASIRDWKRFLRGPLANGSLRETVCDVLMQQKRYLFKGRPEVRVKIWFVEGGMHIFGAGLARLLEQMSRCGTLREAAERAKMSYRHAWGLIRNAEKHYGKPLVIPRPGGVGGGQSGLSEHGRYLLNAYQCVSEQVNALTEECFRDGDPHTRRRGVGRPNDHARGNVGRRA